MALSSSKSPVKKRVKSKVNDGIAHVSATFNNTVVTITDSSGNVLASSSGGQVGFKGSRKGTSFAGQSAAAAVISKAKEVYGLNSLEIVVTGPGSGRESAIRAIISAGLSIKKITDKTPIPHNGCRKRKKRRN